MFSLYERKQKTMNPICFEDLIKCDFNFWKAEAFRQYWKNESVFSYMQIPRPNNGLTLICCDMAIYNLKNGIKLTAKKGDVVFIAKNARYEVTFFGGNQPSHATVLFNFLLLDNNGKEINFDTPLKIICANSDSNIYHQFHELSKIFKNEIYKGPYFKIIMYELISNLSKKTVYINGTDGISKGLEYINSHLNENIKISDIASMCMMSEASFRQKFKKQMRTSPIKYITKVKIEKAIQLLVSSELSIEEISHTLSFYDTAYFYKVFKNITGTLPSAYRQP